MENGWSLGETEGRTVQTALRVEARAARPSLMSVLVEAGVASEQDVQLALVEGAGSGERLGEVLVRRGIVTEEHLGRLLAQQWDLPFLTDDDLAAACALDVISLEDAQRLEACPISVANGRRVVAIVEPTEERIAAAAAIIGGEAVAVVARAALERLFSELGQFVNVSSEQLEEASSGPPTSDESGTDVLLAEVEAAAARLSGLRERVQQLSENERASAASVRDYELQLQALAEARSADLATVERLEREFAEQRRLISTARDQLAAVVALLAATDDGMDH